MLEIENRTPFAAALLPGLDQHGVEHAVVVVKGTFTLRVPGSVALAEAQTPVHLADVFHGDAGTSSVKYAADSTLTKPGTDVYVVGNAYNPGAAAAFVDVSLMVGAVISKV